MKWILNFLFPKRCEGCGQMGSWCCPACLANIKCKRPDLHLNLPEIYLDGLFVATRYQHDSLLARLIARMKYKHGKELGFLLGKWLSQQINRPFDDFSLVPVPLHRERLLERGFNQSELLANHVAIAWNVPIQMLLRRHRPTTPQAQLTRNDRLKNTLFSFSLSESHPLMNNKFILIDDVCSTGSTLNECARVLKSHGAQQVYGLALARGP